MDVKTTEFSAPGKIILFGDHAVVYDRPAIAAAIDIRARSLVSESSTKISTLSVPDLYQNKQFRMNQTIFPEDLTALKFTIDNLVSSSDLNKYFDIEITSEIPSSVGLGSSAAVSVALVASLFSFLRKPFDLEKIKEMAHEAEKIIHSFPSGIDTAISTYGGGILYEKKITRNLSFELSSAYIVITNSLIQRNTKDIVEKVKKKFDKNPSSTGEIFDNIHNIVLEAEKALMGEDLIEIGNLMHSNHNQLKLLGVSHDYLDLIGDILKGEGALGSKLTGAGEGGCVISLFDDYYKASKAIELMKERKFQAFISKFSRDGVRDESV